MKKHLLSILTRRKYLPYLHNTRRPDVIENDFRVSSCQQKLILVPLHEVVYGFCLPTPTSLVPLVGQVHTQSVQIGAAEVAVLAASVEFRAVRDVERHVGNLEKKEALRYFLSLKIGQFSLPDNFDMQSENLEFLLYLA